MRRRPVPRRFAAGLLATTLAVMVLDVSGAAWTSRVREVGAVAFGPILRAIGPEPSAPAIDALEHADRARRSEAELAQLAALRPLLDAPALTGARLVPAMVVAVGAAGTNGIERLTIDVGAKDGITTDQSVVTATGLLGRTVAVGPWTSDVLVLGAADLSVGVRVGATGRLGVLTPSTTQSTGLRVALVEAGDLRVGDQVSTLGSPSGRPFVPGIPVGTVASVDSAQGALTAEGLVTPAADIGSASVVGVLLSAPRSTPRPTVTAGSR